MHKYTLSIWKCNSSKKLSLFCSIYDRLASPPHNTRHDCLVTHQILGCFCPAVWQPLRGIQRFANFFFARQMFGLRFANIVCIWIHSTRLADGRRLAKNLKLARRLAKIKAGETFVNSFFFPPPPSADPILFLHPTSHGRMLCHSCPSNYINISQPVSQIS